MCINTQKNCRIENKKGIKHIISSEGIYKLLHSIMSRKISKYHSNE
jgi:hypothetical protein